MIVNTDVGNRELQGGPLMFAKMIKGGNGDMDSGMSGFGAFPARFQAMAYSESLRNPEMQFMGFGEEETGEETGWVDKIDSLLGSSAKLGDAYAKYVTRNRPTSPATAMGPYQPAPASITPWWLWALGGVAIVSGAYYFLRKK